MMKQRTTQAKIRACGGARGARIRPPHAAGRSAVPARTFAVLLACCSLASWLSAAEAGAAEEGAPTSWKLAEEREELGQPVEVFVEAKRTPGRPAFRIETILDAPPAAAAAELRGEMLSETDVPKGQTRKILERRPNEAVVHTFLDLPLMLADRELALRLLTSVDEATGVHRVDWDTANEVLPPAAPSVVRLDGTRGHWEFAPDGTGRTRAVYESRTEIGGSFPAAIGDRLMKGQAIEAVSRLRKRLEKRKRTHVASERPSAERPQD